MQDTARLCKEREGILVSLRGVVQLVRTPACQTGGRGSCMNVSLLRRLGEKLSASGLIFHTNDHQDHVVTLGTVLGKGQDLLHDAFNDLRPCVVTASSQQRFEPLLSPQFMCGVFRFRDSIRVHNQHIAGFELQGLGAEVRDF